MFTKLIATFVCWIAGALLSSVMAQEVPIGPPVGSTVSGVITLLDGKPSRQLALPGGEWTVAHRAAITLPYKSLPGDASGGARTSGALLVLANSPRDVLLSLRVPSRRHYAKWGDEPCTEATALQSVTFGWRGDYRCAWVRRAESREVGRDSSLADLRQAFPDAFVAGALVGTVAVPAGLGYYQLNLLVSPGALSRSHGQGLGDLSAPARDLIDWLLAFIPLLDAGELGGLPAVESLLPALDPVAFLQRRQQQRLAAADGLAKAVRTAPGERTRPIVGVIPIVDHAEFLLLPGNVNPWAHHPDWAVLRAQVQIAGGRRESFAARATNALVRALSAKGLVVVTLDSRLLDAEKPSRLDYRRLVSSGVDYAVHPAFSEIGVNTPVAGNFWSTAVGYEPYFDLETRFVRTRDGEYLLDEHLEFAPTFRKITDWTVQSPSECQWPALADAPKPSAEKLGDCLNLGIDRVAERFADLVAARLADSPSPLVRAASENLPER